MNCTQQKVHSEVSAAIFNHPSLSHNLVMKHVPGADPELVLLNHYYEELDVSFSFAAYFIFALCGNGKYLKASICTL